MDLSALQSGVLADIFHVVGFISAVGISIYAVIFISEVFNELTGHNRREDAWREKAD